MRENNHSSWTYIPELNCMLFFAQRIDELLFHHTTDTYRYSALSIRGLAAEFCDVYKSVRRGTLNKKNLSHILEEFSERLKTDDIARKVLSDEYTNHFLKCSSSWDIKRQYENFQYIGRRLSNKVYYRQLVDCLKTLISSNKEKKSIDEKAALYVRELLDCGYNENYIYQMLHDVFFHRTVTSLESLDAFFEKFDFAPRKFNVYIGYSSDLSTLLPLFDKLNISDLKVSMLDISSAPIGIKTRRQKTILKFEEIESYDMYSAFEIAEAISSCVINSYSFFRHDTDEVRTYGQVVDSDGNIFTIRSQKLLKHRVAALSREESAHNAEELIKVFFANFKNLSSFSKATRIHKQNPGKPCRLLFVAHREEILKQSLYTFRAVLKDANFGEMFVGNYKPDSIDNLFISIQTFNSQDFTSKTTPEFYDYIIVDEFHHAAAPTYQKLLDYYQPQFLLGLTATPERMDGRSVLSYFNNRIAAEIRLPEAIDRKLLCPFQYFGVTDTVDLDSLKWSAGGYDKGELSRVYTLSGAMANRRADLVVGSLLKYVTDINDVKGLGFCVSIEHAEFMCRYFNEHNIPSMFLTGHSPDEERKTAKQRLVDGEVRFIFVVDIYNEGVDIPEVNTVLFLRPTESLTVFLQQLGRGLRLAEDKECLTVLDFIGQAHKKYNFEDKFAALLSNTTRSVTREIKDGFVSVPKGCYIQLEKQAAKYILENIRASYGNTAGLIARVATFEEDSGLELTLDNFLDYYHLDPRSIYKFSSFSRICARADVIEPFDEPLEETLTKAFARLAVINSRRWIFFLLDILPRLKTVDFAQLTEAEKRMLQMFYITVWSKSAESWYNEEVKENLSALSNSATLIDELISLLQYQYNRIDFIDEPVNLGFDCPLDLHCTYTRDQLLVAMDFMKPATVREGVKWLPDKQLDVFFVTLNKSDKDYSPTTMYNDYSINETLFHWQSQSTTAADSPTGQRYIHHKTKGSKVLLFVREFKSDRITGGAEAYTFLGTASYVTHTGSKPMNITWKLDQPIPAKYLKKTNKLVVG